MDRVIVALGNPGLEYQSTRHNVAWMAIDELDKNLNLIWKDKFKGKYSQLESSMGKVYFLKPQTFMNLSGESLIKLSQFFKVKLEDILVLHDELDLPFGTLTFKSGGGLAGHNGLKSIAASFGAQGFQRLRIGIGRPVHGSVSSWVLSNFAGEEDVHLDEYLKLTSNAINAFIEKGFAKASGLYSKKSITS